MNKNTFLAALKDRLSGRRSTDTNLDAAIGRQFDVVQSSLQNSGRRFQFQIAEASVTVPAGATTPQLVSTPDDFLALSYEDGIRLLDSAGTLLAVLSRRPFVELERKYDNTATYPWFYSLVNKQIYLFPHVTSEHSLEFLYHQSAADFSTLDGTATNYWLENAADYFLGYVGTILEKQVTRNNDESALALFAAQMQEGSRRLEVAEAAAESEDFFPGYDEVL